MILQYTPNSFQLITGNNSGFGGFNNNLTVLNFAGSCHHGYGHGYGSFYGY